MCSLIVEFSGAGLHVGAKGKWDRWFNISIQKPTEINKYLTLPVHLACALGVRTIVLFQNSNFKRWGPPTEIAQIVYKDGGISAEHVLKISLLELYSKEIT